MATDKEHSTHRARSYASYAKVTLTPGGCQVTKNGRKVTILVTWCCFSSTKIPTSYVYRNLGRRLPEPKLRKIVTCDAVVGGRKSLAIRSFVLFCLFSGGGNAKFDQTARVHLTPKNICFSKESTLGPSFGRILQGSIS
jgi:hypothetical protein